jgi:stage II sporulation protein D
MAALAASPLALSACSRKAKNATQSKLPDDANLDDVADAATFRPPFPSSEPIIRVRVLKVRPDPGAGPGAGADPGAGRSLTIGKREQWITLARMDAGLSAALLAPLTVSMRNGGWSIEDAKGFMASVEPREAIALSLSDAGPDQWLELHEVAVPGAGGAPRLYPGTLRLVSRHDEQENAFDVINDVPLESYLPGVLAGELYRHWKPQTFEAQAVAARSFACTEAAVFADRRHYDVSNTAASQMYLGAVDHITSRQAVRATRGQVLGYDGLLVSGYYSSCCGGAAASAVDAIGSNPVNDVPPLHGRSGPDVCTSAPVFQWASEQPLETLSRRMVAFGKDRRMNDLSNLTRLALVEVIAANPNGRPTRMAVTDQAKLRVELTAENFRRAANFAGQGLQPPSKPLKSSNCSAQVGEKHVSFEGYGLGHGVGLCQYGAEALAASGSTFDAILRWYYPGADIVSAYG